MSDRYEITDDGSRIRIQQPGKGQLTLYAHEHESDTQKCIGAIRQQARDIAALKDALADEMNANEVFRKAGGAHDGEDMPTFCARLIAERDRLRADLAWERKTTAALRRDLADPPPDIQELALKRCGHFEIVEKLQADLAAAVAERDQLRASWYAIDAERDTLRARLAAIDVAPTVITITPMGWIHETADNLPIGTELIARPAKES